MENKFKRIISIVLLASMVITSHGVTTFAASSVNAFSSLENTLDKNEQDVTAVEESENNTNAFLIPKVKTPGFYYERMTKIAESKVALLQNTNNNEEETTRIDEFESKSTEGNSNVDEEVENVDENTHTDDVSPESASEEELTEEENIDNSTEEVEVDTEAAETSENDIQMEVRLSRQHHTYHEDGEHRQLWILPCKECKALRQKVPEH